MSDLSKTEGWAKIREQVLQRDGYLCQYCHTNQATHVDHVVPRAKGGTEDLTNLVAACRRCNLAKGAKTLVRTTWLNSKYFKTDKKLSDEPR